MPYKPWPMPCIAIACLGRAIHAKEPCYNYYIDLGPHEPVQLQYNYHINVGLQVQPNYCITWNEGSNIISACPSVHTGLVHYAIDHEYACHSMSAQLQQLAELYMLPVPILGQQSSMQSAITQESNDSDHLDKWLQGLLRFFKLHCLTGIEKDRDCILVAGTNLRGKAKHWYSHKVKWLTCLIHDWTFKSIVTGLFRAFITTVMAQ